MSSSEESGLALETDSTDGAAHATDPPFRVGWAKRDMEIAPRGRAMNGYGMWTHRAVGQRTPLYARAMYIASADGGRPLVFCLLDLAMVTYSIRSSVVEALTQELGEEFWDEGFVLACTHTHSGPGGCGWEAMYNVVTPGFVPEHLDHVVRACVGAVLEAREQAAPTDLAFLRGDIDPSVDVAWNRSLSAYNRNPEVAPRPETETHLALSRTMDMITARREDRLRSFVSMFGVHATCLGNTLDQHDGDNKGYAAAHAESVLAAAGDGDSDPPPVAFFAQGTAGDVSPHYHGPGDRRRRKALTGEEEYAYARRNGERQSEHAVALAQGRDEAPITGPLDAVLTYLDFSDQPVDPQYAEGDTDAFTSEACHGVAFFRGTRIDGPGIPRPVGAAARAIARAVRRRRLSPRSGLSDQERSYYRRLYAAQSPKAILLEAGRKRALGRPLDRILLPGFVDPTVRELKRQAEAGALATSPLVPSVLPVQIVRLGPLAVVCCPGEFTTVAGQRLVATVQDALGDLGVREVLICTYCNDYMGYVTTHQEYEQQNYEGGHTIFGKWTLGAFQGAFRQLAEQLRSPEGQRSHDRTTRPPGAVTDELALRTNRGQP